MRIQPIQQINFGYSNKLKTLWKKGLMPSVKYGFYGDKLTKENVTLEHLQPHSQGGKTELYNLVLASKRNNNRRGNDDIRKYINKENIARYFSQFLDVQLKNFNGFRYIHNTIENLKKLGVIK